MGGDPKVGDGARCFRLPDQDGKEVALRDFKGKWLILYFYPRDNTSGCTKEALDFSESTKDFSAMGAAVVGVSPDSTKSHMKFMTKHDLKIKLLSDPEHKVLEKYGVWRPKKMYGLEHYAVVRTTFLIDPRGKIAHIWPKVKVKAHVAEVKEKLSKLT